MVDNILTNLPLRALLGDDCCGVVCVYVMNVFLHGYMLRRAFIAISLNPAPPTILQLHFNERTEFR